MEIPDASGRTILWSGNNKVKIGISSYAYRWAVGTGDFIPTKPLSLFVLLDKAAALGAQVVQILDNFPLEHMPDAVLCDLARHAQDLGLTLEVGYQGGGAEQLRRYIVVARKLDARILRVVLGNGHPRLGVSDLAPMICKNLPDMRAGNVTLAIENHFDLLPSELVTLLKAIDDPCVGVCLDPLNSIGQLVGPREVIGALAPYTVSVHAKDGVVSRMNTGFYVAGCPLGKGLVDLREMVETVCAAGRSPNLLVEAWMDRLEGVEETLVMEETWVRDGIAYLRNLKAGSEMSSR
jgi:3-oxoisoapionate decarboxylase